MLSVNGKTLYEAKKDDALKVASVPDIGLMESLGLRVGSKVSVLSRYGLGGPVLLRVEDAYTLALGKDIAKQVGVSCCEQASVDVSRTAASAATIQGVACL